MRTAQRTLIMVRQAATASTALECYQSLAAAAYVGGAARNGGENLIDVIEALIASAATTPTRTTGTSTRPGTTTRPTTTTGPNPAVPPPADKENVKPSGTVLIKVRGKFVPLENFKQVPFGTELDTTKGRVALTSHDGSKGTFYEGSFKLLRGLDTPVPGRKSRRVVEIVLTGGDFKACTRATAGAAKPKPKPVRHAWGNAKGSFRTKGRFAAATVRGTLWRTDDLCTGTLITVKRGKVDVLDRVRRKHVLVTAGHSYLAVRR